MKSAWLVEDIWLLSNSTFSAEGEMIGTEVKPPEMQLNVLPLMEQPTARQLVGKAEKSMQKFLSVILMFG